ncbi:MAG: hypothetical protein Q4P28_02780 [Tissierellia bacterium]|nr:hypothetical protein [Tissierellia bacterium]
MKKILLILLIGILVSCSTQQENTKKENEKEIDLKQEESKNDEVKCLNFGTVDPDLMSEEEHTENDESIYEYCDKEDMEQFLSLYEQLEQMKPIDGAYDIAFSESLFYGEQLIYFDYADLKAIDEGKITDKINLRRDYTADYEMDVDDPWLAEFMKFVEERITSEILNKGDE